MTKPRVIVGPAPLKAVTAAYAPALTAAGVEWFYPARHAQMTEPELAAQLPGCVASLTGSEPYTRAVIAAAAEKGLRVLARAGVGYDNIDLAAATDHGIAVTYAPGTNHDAVGEQALLMMLALLKKLVAQNEQIRGGAWPRKSYRSLRGLTVGVVGLGRTGKAVALRAKAFDVTVVATEPVPDHDFVRHHGVRLVTFEELLAVSDIVTMHVPLKADTRHMIDAAALQKMKPSALLVNAARGGVVDEPALYEALKAGRLAGAGLDVFETEPPGANPLLTLDNVVATAHTAGIDERAIFDMGRVAAEAIQRLLAGDWPADWVVNPEVKDRFFAR